MFIARQLRKENIAEYLLYMWQIEDLIRSYNFDIDKIETQIVEPYLLAEAEKKQLKEWYESLIDMMRSENVQQKGHLQINKNIISQLDEFHSLLLKSGNDTVYTAGFNHILPALTQFRQKQSENLPDIELCFNIQYAIMLLRMKKQQITPQTQAAQKEISKFLVLLSKNFQKYQAGELDLEEDEA